MQKRSNFPASEEHLTITPLALTPDRNEQARGYPRAHSRNADIEGVHDLPDR